MKQSRKDFIKQAHESACSDWKKNIENEFPKLFKNDDLEVGKWYNWNGSRPAMGFLSKKPSKHSGCYQFDYLINGETKSYDSLHISNLSLATEKEVAQALIKEAKKKGFQEGVKFISAWNQSSICNFNGMYFNIKNNSLSSGRSDNDCIFQNGKWAEIIKETITKEQAEKELGKIIEG